MGQDTRIVSHYPATAYITERLLPFSVVNEGADQDIHIQSVYLIKGKSCRSIIDPFYKKIFHIYCKKSTRVQVDVSVVSAGQETSKISTDELHIREKDEAVSSSEEGRGYHEFMELFCFIHPDFFFFPELQFF